MSIIKKIKPSWLFFIFSLFFLGIIFYLVRSFMTNFDENDHLAVAFLMQKGRILYKDIFSHHFPFPYYWTYLFTPFWKQDSPSRTISIFRLSILAFYFINFMSVFLSYKNKKSQYAISFWIILLSLFFTLYHGNLVLSETFAAILIVSIFWIYTPIFIGWETISDYSLFLSIIFTSLAFWTQPLLFSLSFIPLLLAPKNKKIKIFVFISTINLIPVLFFYFSGQLLDFFKQSIWFNFSVYPKFYVDIVPNGDKWWGTIVYFFRNQIFFLTHFFNKHQLFQFILNIGLVVLLLKIIKTKKTIYIISFLLIFLAIHIRETKIIPGEPFNFGIYPLISISSSALVVLLAKLFYKQKILFSLITFSLLLVSILNFWPIIKNSFDLQYNYHVFWSPRQKIGDLIGQLSLPNENVLVYPHDVDLYYFADRTSFDRFVYWFPWIDLVSEYRSQRLSMLNNSPPAVIYIGNLDFKGESNFYSQYFPNLTKNYIEVFKDNKPTSTWIRIDLVNRLQPLNLSSHASTNE